MGQSIKVISQNHLSALGHSILGKVLVSAVPKQEIYWWGTWGFPVGQWVRRWQPHPCPWPIMDFQTHVDHYRSTNVSMKVRPAFCANPYMSCFAQIALVCALITKINYIIWMNVYYLRRFTFRDNASSSSSVVTSMLSSYSCKSPMERLDEEAACDNAGRAHPQT